MEEKWENLTNNTRYFIITGGRGSGKSFEIGRFAVLLSYYPNERILYTRQTMTSAQVSIIPEIQEKINYIDKAHDFQPVNNKIINTSTKSYFEFQISPHKLPQNYKNSHHIPNFLLNKNNKI